MKASPFKLMFVGPVIMYMIGCNENSKVRNMVEVTAVSIFFDSTPQRGFNITLVAKLDTAQKLTLFVKEEEAKDPPLNLKDTLIRKRLKVERINIEKSEIGPYYSNIICFNDSQWVEYKSRPVDAIKLASIFDAPIFVNSALLSH